MNWKYENKETGKIEEVPLEKWVWVATYKDGTELHQFDKKGVFHRIGEIDQEAIDKFVMYNTDDPKKRIDIVIPEGGKLIHKYRNFILNAGRPEERRERVYVCGYKKGSQYHFNFIFPKGMIIQSTEENLKLVDYLM